MATSHFYLPYGYKEAPPWPSLYWPFGPNFNPMSLIADIPHSLYYMKGISISQELPQCITIQMTIPLPFQIFGNSPSYGLFYSRLSSISQQVRLIYLLISLRIPLADVEPEHFFSLGIWAYFMFLKSHTFRWYMLVLIPLVFVLAGCLSSFIIGSVVGMLKNVIIFYLYGRQSGVLPSKNMTFIRQSKILFQVSYCPSFIMPASL
jgi:hypothetical protein